MELALPVTVLLWQPISHRPSLQFLQRIFHLLFTAMASNAGAFGQSDSDSEDDFYGFVDVGVSNSSSATGILAEITESDIDASEVDDSDSDSDSLPPDSGSDSGESVTEEEPVWGTQLHDVTLRHVFDASAVGPTHTLGDGARIIDFFLLFIPMRCIVLMCEMTNLYASQIQASLGKVDVAWVPVVEADIKTFLGILIIMGLHKGLRMHSYWSNDEALGVLAIKKAMSRNRFAKIQQYFHLNDRHAELRKEDVGYDRLQKIRPLLSICKETFRANFNPARELSIDEGMVKFKGRLGFIQYMPMKPTKRGIKVWMLASPANGYTHEVDVYCGRSDGMTAEHGLGYNVVMKLSTPYHGKGHHIFYDNFFSSVELLRDLLKKSTYACGTMRSNRRGYPLKNVGKLRRGELQFRQTSDRTMVACAWQDKRTVHSLSSTSNPALIETRRRAVAGVQDVVMKPQPIADYNRFMGGVDLADQLRQVHTIHQKHRMWWKYLCFYLLDVSIVNAYIVYKATPGVKSVSHLQFNTQLAHQLIGGRVHSGFRRAKAEQNVQVIASDNIGFNKLQPLSGRKRVCVVCSRVGRRTAKGRRIETSYGCTACSAPLCRNKGCFDEHHPVSMPQQLH